MPFLTSQDRTYINSLPNNQPNIPAWLIAQLLDVSDRVHCFATSQPVPNTVLLNNLLASPDQYRTKMVSLKAMFIESSDVTRELQLLPPDQCWSVILLDAEYHQPIQVFTTKDPSRFPRGSEVLAIGYYLANRLDRPKRGSSSQVVVVPMFIGSLLPSGGEKPRPSTSLIPFSSAKSFLVLFTVLAFMMIMYFSIKIYVSKRFWRQKSSPLNAGRHRDENGRA